MPLSTNYLKYALGYTDEVDEHFAELITAGNWQDLLLKQPIHEQFWGQLSIATDETTTLSTLANNCRFYVTYDNSIQNQLVAETFFSLCGNYAGNICQHRIGYSAAKDTNPYKGDERGFITM